MDPKRIAMNQIFRRWWYLKYARKKQAAATAKRKASGEKRKVYYYHQVTMPHASLTAQILEKLANTYDIEIVQRLCNSPDSGMLASQYEEKFYPFMRKDAADIAPFYGLSFTDIGRQPNEALAFKGSQLLAAVLGTPQFIELAPKVTDAVWQEDEVTLNALAQEHSMLDKSATKDLMKQHEAERLDHGYVYGGTFYFEAEWFFGPDRIHYLEERLMADGARKDVGTDLVVKRPEIVGLKPAGADQVTLEMFASVRSPYTHESFQRVFDLAATTGCKLVGRPVRPIIMRFEKINSRPCQAKYVYYDSAREAERYNVPQEKYYEMGFRPTELVYSLFEWADNQGKGLELLYSFTIATFGEGLDGGKDSTLKHVVERVGLSWNEAKAIRGNSDWFEKVKQNEDTMLSQGLWGVPSFRVTAANGQEFSTWGADRLWLLEAKIAEFSVNKVSTEEMELSE